MGRTRTEKDEYARKLRENPTQSEALVLEWLKKQGRDYPRHSFQVIIIGWIVDFLFPDQSVILEVDGSIHDKDPQKTADRLRTKTLWKAGYRVIRCKNSDIKYLGVESALAPLTKELSKRGAICNMSRSYGQTTRKKAERPGQIDGGPCFSRRLVRRKRAKMRHFQRSGTGSA